MTLVSHAAAKPGYLNGHRSRTYWRCNARIVKPEEADWLRSALFVALQQRAGRGGNLEHGREVCELLVDLAEQFRSR